MPSAVAPSQVQARRRGFDIVSTADEDEGGWLSPPLPPPPATVDEHKPAFDETLAQQIRRSAALQQIGLASPTPAQLMHTTSLCSGWVFREDDDPLSYPLVPIDAVKVYTRVPSMASGPVTAAVVISG